MGFRPLSRDPVTIRDARLAIRVLEAAVDSVRTAPATALGFAPRYYLHRAQAALRQAERALAKADDARLEPLKPLAPQVDPPRRGGGRRKRYRCTTCFRELLARPDDIEIDPYHSKGRKTDTGMVFSRCGEWQVVPPALRNNNPRLRRKRT